MKIQSSLFILFILLTCIKANAQCQLTKKVSRGIVIIQGETGYLYNRSVTDYHAIAFKTVLIQKQALSSIVEEIKFTTTNSFDEPKTAALKLTDGQTIILPLKFTGKEITDDKKLITKVYSAEPDNDALNKLKLLNITALILNNTSGNTISEFIFTDNAIIKQSLACLQTVKSN